MHAESDYTVPNHGRLLSFIIIINESKALYSNLNFLSLIDNLLRNQHCYLQACTRKSLSNH